MALQTMRRVKKKYSKCISNQPRITIRLSFPGRTQTIKPSHPESFTNTSTQNKRFNFWDFTLLLLCINMDLEQADVSSANSSEKLPDSLTMGYRIYGHQASLKVLLVKPNSQSSVNAILLLVIMCVIMPAPTIAPCLSCAKEMSV